MSRRWQRKPISKSWPVAILKGLVIGGIGLLAYQLCAETLNSNIDGGSWLIPDRWFICVEIIVASFVSCTGVLLGGKP